MSFDWLSRKLARSSKKFPSPREAWIWTVWAELLKGRHDYRPVAGADRSTAYTWSRWFRDGGIEALCEERRGRARPTLHIVDPRLIRTGGNRKDSVLFISMLEELERSYPHARRLVLILDNYGVYKSRVVNRWLAAHPRFELLFQPAYHPWVNQIERLWKTMHDTVTRNHRCRSLEELCAQVSQFLAVVEPFPGSGHGLAKMAV